jgi:hypothetical protein
MTNAQWARAALLAVALPACAHAHGSPAVAPSLAAGQAAQPGSYIPHAAREPAASQVIAAEGAARGQAAQPHSWTTLQQPAAVSQHDATAGSPHVGGRAAQPYSWIDDLRGGPAKAATPKVAAR